MGLSYIFEKSDVNPYGPLIYMWQVKNREGIPVFEYVGKAVNGSDRPRKAYSKNVSDLLSGKYWHSDKTKDFREVHWVLAGAAVEKYKISLRFLCNCTADDINQREREHQAKYIVSNNANREAIASLIGAAKTA